MIGSATFTSASGTTYACSAPGSALANIISDGNGGHQWSDGTYARSCYYYKYPPLGDSYSGLTGDGIYTIDADGPLGDAPFHVCCDMTSQDGGWTLVVGISGSDTSHINIGAVNPVNLYAPGRLGKFADSVINNLKSGISPAYRLTCANVTGYFPANCEFIATFNASGACTAESYAYPPASYGTGRYVQNQITGLADGDNATASRLIYGDPQLSGCATAALSFNQSGSLWAR